MMRLDRRGLLTASAGLMVMPSAAASVGAGIFGDLSQAELDRAYDQRVWAPNANEVQMRYISASREVTRQLPPISRRYGLGPHQIVDIFAPPNARAAPVIAIVHGGAWQLAMREAHYGPAPAIVGAGCICVVIGFDCIPTISLSAMAAQISEALLWIRQNIRQFGGNGDNIRLIGHSSGAHLAAVMLTTTTGLRGGALLGGMFDLYPVKLSSRNVYLHLSDAEVVALSPIRHLDQLSGDLIIASGSAESPEFKRQSRVFSDVVQGMGRLDQTLIIPNCNHFEQFEQLYDARTPLMSAVLASATS